jgi:hypothetical protein
VEETLADSTEEVLATFRLYHCKSIAAMSKVLMGTSRKCMHKQTAVFIDDYF